MLTNRHSFFAIMIAFVGTFDQMFFKGFLSLELEELDMEQYSGLNVPPSIFLLGISLIVTLYLRADLKKISIRCFHVWVCCVYFLSGPIRDSSFPKQCLADCCIPTSHGYLLSVYFYSSNPRNAREAPS